MSADIEAFVPPYLLRGVRPVITDVSSLTPARGDEISLNIAPDINVTSVVLMGTGATTHWVDAGIPRRLVLPVWDRLSNRSNDRLESLSHTVVAVLPADPNILPLGHYMLFAMVDDIPSEAVIIQVVDSGPAIPTVSQWGLVVTFLLVVTTGTLVYARRLRMAV